MRRRGHNVVLPKSAAWLYSIGARTPFANSPLGRPSPFRPTVLFRDNWLDVGAGPFPAEVLANVNPAKWTNNAYFAGNTLNHDAFFDGLGTIYAQDQSGQLGLTSAALTYNPNKPHGIILENCILETNGFIVGFAEILGTGAATNAWSIAATLFGTLLQVQLGFNGGGGQSFNTPFNYTPGRPAFTLQLDIGAFNGTQRVITAYLNGSAVLTNTQAAGAALNTNHVAMQLQPSGSADTATSVSMQRFSFYGFPS